MENASNIFVFDNESSRSRDGTWENDSLHTFLLTLLDSSQNFLNGREQTKMSTRLASTCVCDFIFLQHSFLFQFTPTLTVCSDYTASTATTFFLMDWIEMDRNAILRLELHKEEVGKLRMQHTAHLLVFI